MSTTWLARRNLARARPRHRPRQRLEFSGAAQLRPLVDEPRAGDGDFELGSERLAERQDRVLDRDLGVAGKAGRLEQLVDHLLVVRGGCRANLRAGSSGPTRTGRARHGAFPWSNAVRRCGCSRAPSRGRDCACRGQPSRLKPAAANAAHSARRVASAASKLDARVALHAQPDPHNRRRNRRAA